MNPDDIYPRARSNQESATQNESKPTVFVKELGEKHRHRILRHFLGLEKNDRLLRFGSHLSDELIANYVAQINFSRDKVFGVFSHSFRLVGVGHLAYAQRSQADIASEKERVAEFGVSVSSSARGKGVGSALFKRGAIHCRNDDIDTLYMHCLASNQTMIHIAKKAGMEIQRDYGEADAYLKLPPADASSVLAEAMQEQVATLDYGIKANARAALKWWRELRGLGITVRPENSVTSDNSAIPSVETKAKKEGQ